MTQTENYVCWIRSKGMFFIEPAWRMQQMLKSVGEKIAAEIPENIDPYFGVDKITEIEHFNCRCIPPKRKSWNP